MQVVDTSALVAIVQAEPDSARLGAAMARSSANLISAVSVIEASMVLSARAGLSGLGPLDTILGGTGVEIVPFDLEQARIAREAFSRYGKGQGHPARLNLGDCCAYALAKARGLPLLFKGDDFPRTDVVAAAW